MLKWDVGGVSLKLTKAVLHSKRDHFVVGATGYMGRDVLNLKWDHNCTRFEVWRRLGWG